MKANIFLYFLGTAGAGKSTMTGAFQSWMIRQGYDAVIVNLDPGAMNLPYTPDVDIRDWVKLEEVMDEYNLGPNGAQVTSSDMMYLHIDDIRETLDGFRTDYFLVDTPGQIELFAYREPTQDLIRCISSGKSIVIYLFEPILASTPAGLVSQLSLAATVKYKLGMPFIQVLNKIDLLDEEDRERMERWRDPDCLYEDLTTWGMPDPEPGPDHVGPPGSIDNELGVSLFRALESTGEMARFIPCSGKTMQGMEDIYSMVQAVFMGGEDLDKE